MLWGVLESQNRSGRTVVLDSVKFAENPDHVALLSDPYVWDESRFDLLGMGGLAAYPLPLPERWKELPVRHAVQGYAITSGQRVESGDPVAEYDGGSAEVLFELAVPERAATVSGITLRYHVGPLAYEKTYDASVTLCPPGDLEPCSVDA